MDWRRIRRGHDPAEEALSDARPLSEVRLEPEEPPSNQPFYRGRGIIFVLSVVFVAGAVAGLFADGGFIELSRLRGQRAELREEIAERRGRVEALGTRVERLHGDPAARERIAREQLGYARKGEIVFLLPRSVESSDVDQGGAP